MNKLFRSILLLVLIVVSQQGFSQIDEFKVIGYFPNWANMNDDIEKLDCSKLTHINWAFQNPDANGNLVESNNGLSKLVKKAHEANVQVFISIGGGAASSGNTMKYYFDLISTENKRANFVHKIVDYVKKYDLQGVDVDLEGPAINANYDVFIGQLCDSLRPQGYFITAALNGMGSDNFKDQTIELFDWINIMSYDATGSWTPNNPGQHASYDYAVTGIENWGARGAEKKQLVVGVPFYGHAFNDLLYMDYWNYNQIIERYPDCYNYDERGNVIYYNGISTIKKKAYLALDRAGGIMIWALSYDVYNEYSLLKAIDDARKAYDPDDKAPVMSFDQLSGDTLIASNAFGFTAIATDSDGVFEMTTLSLNEIELATSNEDTTHFEINNLSDGTYELKITGTDHQNRSGSLSFALVVDGAPRLPYNNVPANIPGIIEAENYDAGADGFTFSDSEEENQGGRYRSNSVDIEACSDLKGTFNVGWTNAGEWLEYSVNVEETASYKTLYRVATASAGKKLYLECDGISLTKFVTMPNTGGWQNWITVESERFVLEKGNHIIRLVFDTNGININNFSLEQTSPLSSELLNNKTNITVYPSMVSDFICIDRGYPIETKVEIYDASGRLSYQTEVDATKLITLNVEQLHQGIYTLIVYTAEEQIPFRFIKE